MVAFEAQQGGAHLQRGQVLRSDGCRLLLPRERPQKERGAPTWPTLGLSPSLCHALLAGTGALPGSQEGAVQGREAASYRQERKQKWHLG